MNPYVYGIVLLWLAFEGIGTTLMGLFHVKKSQGEYGTQAVFVGMSLVILLVLILLT